MQIKFINQENELIRKFDCTEETALLFMSSSTFSLREGDFANIGSHFDLGDTAPWMCRITIVAKQIIKE